MSLTRLVLAKLAPNSTASLLSGASVGLARIMSRRDEHTGGKKDDDCSTKQSPENKKKQRGKTPRGKLDDEFDDAPLSYNEKEPLEKHPGGVNPKTGEYGGPAGPEPTRYGDWERKGRVSDF